MSRPTFTRVHDVNAEVQEAFGLSEREFTFARKNSGTIPNAIFNLFIDVVDYEATGLIDEWEKADRKSPAGRHALIPLRAVVVILMLSAFWGKKYSAYEACETISDRLTLDQFEQLGINPVLYRDERENEDRCKPFSRALDRLCSKIDPGYLTRSRTRLDANAFLRAKALESEEREERGHQLGNALARSSFKKLPAKFLEFFRGDVALDSTLIPIQGRVNYGRSSKKGRAKILLHGQPNPDFQSGPYARNITNYDGGAAPASTKLRNGYELDTPALVDAKNGDWAFPLIPSIGFHRPAEITKGPRRAMEEFARMTTKRGLVLADRAFNGMDPGNFQEPLRKLRFEAVFDYKYNQLGQNGYDPKHPDIVIVDGIPYVNRMQEEVRQISRWYAENQRISEKAQKARTRAGASDGLDESDLPREKHLNPVTGEPYTLEERDTIMAQREPYRLKRLTGIDKDGYQRFQMPDPRTYVAFDPVTGRITDEVPAKGLAVTIRLEHQLIKQLQRFPWQSPEWFRAYGQRNQVEASNKGLKDPDGVDLDNPKRRTARGWGYTYLISMIGVAVTNLTRIVTGIKKLAKRTAKLTGRGSRRRRRTDGAGNALPHRSPTGTRETGDPPDSDSSE